MDAQRFSSTKLLLIRHGQARSADGSYDEGTPLSALGQRQAQQVADVIGTVPPPMVYTSPFTRAVETAMPLCQRLNQAPIIDPRLAEFEFGPATLDSIEERPDLHIWQSTHRATMHGESLGEFMERVVAFCEEIIAQHLDESVAIFAHAGTLDAAIRWALGLRPDAIWQHEFNLANASITAIDYWPQGRNVGGSPRYAALQRIGDIAHLGIGIK